jgi:ABC-type multidrug transport system fused ATPase/permease subunit
MPITTQNESSNDQSDIKEEIVLEVVPAASIEPAALPEIQNASTWGIIKAFGNLVLTQENRPRIAAATLLSFVNSGLNFLSSYLLSKTIQSLSSEDETATIAGVELSKMALISTMVGSYYLSQVLPNIRDQIIAPVSVRSNKNLLIRSTDHLLRKSLNYHNITPDADKIYLIQKSYSLSSLGTPLLTQIAPTLIQTSIAGTLLATQYGALMGGSVVILLASYTAYSALTSKPIVKINNDLLQAGNKAWVHLTNAIYRYKVMRDFGKHDETIKDLDSALSQWASIFVESIQKPLRFGIGHTTISYTHMLLASLYIGFGVGSKNYSAQDFVVIVSYLMQLSSSLPAFGQAVNLLFASYPDLKFVFGKLTQPDEVFDANPKTLLPRSLNTAPSIEFENVSFSYPPKTGEAKAQPILNNLSFRVAPGQRIALVSKSGAGKTTIFNLLYRYYTPTTGVIKINGHDVSKVSLYALQDSISLLGQKPSLFKGSIRQNICYGAPRAEAVTDEHIWSVARGANLEGFLKEFPGGLQTDVGDKGDALSGGQQQKVAILRSLMKQSSIKLFDEMTASLDGKSASEVLQALSGSESEVTRLMITHKLSEVQFVDQILVLGEGRLIAQGTHEELLATCSLYQELWHQTRDQASKQALVSSNANLFATSRKPVESEELDYKTEESITLTTGVP